LHAFVNLDTPGRNVHVTTGNCQYDARVIARPGPLAGSHNVTEGRVMALRVGDTAPDATVFMRPREPVQLSAYRGQPTVLLFFPLAFSGVCTKEMCTMAEDYRRYRALGAEVLGISIDSPYVNAKFAEACNATFPIVSDFNKEATTAYDVMRADLGGLQGVSERSVFVIDRNGVITYAWVGENPGVMPSFEEIEAAVQQLRAP
jgi:peroxiredoxin